MLTDQELADIAERHKERKEFRDHIPGGKYFYDSLGYVYNEWEPKRRVGILVRNQEWFKRLDMDANLTKADRDVAPDLGQYLAAICDKDLEADIAALLTEVRRLRRDRATRR